MKSSLARAALALTMSACMAIPATAKPPSPPGQGVKHTFSIGDEAFLLDGKPLVIRTGEMHFTRVPHEYWRHRLQLIRAMGMNAVCAYLFWNFHEFEQGTFNWKDQADAAEFCRIAHEEGLWVVLRPGPYVCAEWDGGGLPWWLLKNPDIQLRTQDPEFMKASTAWFKEVGRVLAPLQVTKGGPILLAQVENEYGSYGNDAEYMGQLRQALIDSGFDIPLFACNPVYDLGKGNRPDLFNVVNFGRDAKGAFEKLRAMQPKGPLMCGEFYPGWFDTWGSPHHFGNIESNLKDLDYMLQNKGSFSLYMAHGGTSFGLWAGADRPFKPDTSSYDYDAPISEAGWIGDKFERTRELMRKHLLEGETIPDPPAPIPVMAVDKFAMTAVAPVFGNLPPAIKDESPRHMELYDQGQGCIVYRTEIPAGPATTLKLDQAHDFGWVFVNGKQVGYLDRRSRKFSTPIPAREKPAQLDIFIEAMGHVNFGKEIHDRKGIRGDVKLGDATLKGNWEVFPLRLDSAQLAGLKWQPLEAFNTNGPAFWQGSLLVSEAQDTFLDLSHWGKGVVWINGKCLGRFWNIGPTQTAYLPGAWLKSGVNEIIILDLLGPKYPLVAGVKEPVLNQLRPELDFASKATSMATLKLDGVKPALEASFTPGGEAQTISLPQHPVGRQFCIEMLNAHDGKPYSAIAEFDILDPNGRSFSHQDWTIAYVSSEELAGEDGSASNAIDGQSANFWHSEWKNKQPAHPHRLVIDLGSEYRIGGFRYTPRAGDDNPGRIKDYRIYIGNQLAEPAAAK
jgi:beta-galactosidase